MANRTGSPIENLERAIICIVDDGLAIRRDGRRANPARRGDRPQRSLFGHIPDDELALSMALWVGAGRNQTGSIGGKSQSENPPLIPRKKDAPQFSGRGLPEANISPTCGGNGPSVR